MFSKIKGLKILENPSFSKSNNWLNILYLTKEFKRSTKWIEKKLSDNNIECRYIWRANHKQKKYLNKFKYKISKSEKLIKNSLCLPSSPDLKKNDILKIVNLINE